MLRRVIAGVLLALALFPGATTLVARADDSPAAQCTKNSNDHLGVAAPWDGACWAGVFQNVTRFAGDTVATSVTRWVMSGAVEATDLLLNEFGSGTSTRPQFSTPWFQKVYFGNVAHRGTAFAGQPGALAIAEMLAVPLLVMTIVAGVLRGDIGGAMKTVLVRLPLIVVLCFAFITVLQHVFDLVDGLSGWVVGGTVADFQAWTAKFDPSNVGADFAVVVVSLVIIVTTLIAYIELFVRSAMIYLVVAFVPIISIATLWQGSRTALKKTVEFLAVMTCSKLVMAFAFMIGAGALTAGDAQNFAPLLVGAVIFGVIAFAPFSLFALIPLVEVAAVGAVAGMGARFGSRMVNSSVAHSRELVGAAPDSIRGMAKVPSNAKGALDAGARRLQPLGQGLRVLGAGALGHPRGAAPREAGPTGTPTPSEAPAGSTAGPYQGAPLVATRMGSVSEAGRGEQIDV